MEKQYGGKRRKTGIGEAEPESSGRPPLSIAYRPRSEALGRWACIGSGDGIEQSLSIMSHSRGCPLIPISLAYSGISSRKNQSIQSGSIPKSFHHVM